MKNKKILFLILFGILVFPVMACAQGTSPTVLINGIKGAFMTVAQGVVVIGWLIAGILWLISSGSPEKIGTAKKATIAAVIGTVVVLLAPPAYESIKALLGLSAPVGP